MAYHHLTIEERERIRSLREGGASMRKIGRELGRAPSTISRELKRNGRGEPQYGACRAQRRADWRRSTASRRRKLDNAALRDEVTQKLRLGWSPEQVAGRMGLERPEGPRVSCRSIYRNIDRLRKRKDPVLRTFPRCPKKRPKSSSWGPGRMIGRVGIEHRPPEVATRQSIGHWEGDTLLGAGRRGALVTYVERKSRYLVASRVCDMHPETVNAATFRAMRGKIPLSKRRTITLDNGFEFRHFAPMGRGLRMRIYFAEPYKPWQRPTMENTNGLLRHYLSKKTDLRKVSQRAVNRIVESLNNRPRKCLNWRTPAEVLFDEPP
jgi:transposase, IS30 family